MKNGKYELVVPPPEYPGKRYRGRYAYEHHVVFWYTHGRLPAPGCVVHHKNDQKRHNVSDNLEEKTRAQHTADHGRRGVTYKDLICSFCGVSFLREARLCPENRKKFYCCRSHHVKDQWKRGIKIGRRKK